MSKDTFFEAASRPFAESLPDAAILAWTHDFAPYGVLTTDREFRVTTWNSWMARHSGKAAPEVVNHELFEIFPDLKQRGLTGRFERALHGESSLLSTALHAYLFRMDPSVPEGGFEEMQQTARIAPLVYDEEILGVIVVVEDVTQREAQAGALRQQHERDMILSWALAHLLEAEDPRHSIRELFLKIAEHLDWEGYLLFLGSPGEATLRLQAAGGITPEAEQTLSIIDSKHPLAHALLFDGEPGEPRNDSARDALRSLGFRASVILPLQSGDERIGVLCFGARSRTDVREGELDLLRTLGKYLSVALQKEATRRELEATQAKLNEHAESLERQVAHRTVELREIIADLERFSYTLAHDLRAPIRALIGYSRVLQEDCSEAMSKEGQTILRNLRRACEQLDGLTLDMLEFSKVSRADLTLEPVDVDEVVSDAVALLPAAQGRVTIKQPLHRVVANRTLLRQTIMNLIDNAVKFAKEGEPARISISSQLLSEGESFRPSKFNLPSKTGGGGAARPQQSASRIRMVRIIVGDEGIGIAPELHKKIFGIFERGTSSAKYRGTGIGLAIVARALERMGGTCGVDSTPNVGSRFWLELPAAETP